MKRKLIERLPNQNVLGIGDFRIMASKIKEVINRKTGKSMPIKKSQLEAHNKIVEINAAGNPKYDKSHETAMRAAAKRNTGKGAKEWEGVSGVLNSAKTVKAVRKNMKNTGKSMPTKKTPEKKPHASVYLRAMAKLDRGLSKVLTGQVADTNVQKRLRDQEERSMKPPKPEKNKKKYAGGGVVSRQMTGFGAARK
jgi:hypothetical protein